MEVEFTDAYGTERLSWFFNLSAVWTSHGSAVFARSGGVAIPRAVRAMFDVKVDRWFYVFRLQRFACDFRVALNVVPMIVKRAVAGDDARDLATDLVDTVLCSVGKGVELRPE